MTIRCYTVNKIIEIGCNRFEWSSLWMSTGSCSVLWWYIYKKKEFPTTTWTIQTKHSHEKSSITMESLSITDSLLVWDTYYLILMFNLLTKWFVSFVEADNSVCWKSGYFDLECCIQRLLFRLFVSTGKSFQWSAVFTRFIA